MNKLNYRLVVGYFILYVAIQIPLLYKFNLGPNTLAFFYTGFLLFLPLGIRPLFRLLIGFGVGLFIDIFTNTPGLHAGISVLILFIRDQYYGFTVGDSDEDPNLSIFHLGLKGVLLYLIPLIFAHLFFIFLIEHGKWEGFGLVLKRTLFSTIFTVLTVIVLNFVVAKKPERL
jgi:hypothetical protein